MACHQFSRSSAQAGLETIIEPKIEFIVVVVSRDSIRNFCPKEDRPTKYDIT